MTRFGTVVFLSFSSDHDLVAINVQIKRSFFITGSRMIWAEDSAKIICLVEGVYRSSYIARSVAYSRNTVLRILSSIRKDGRLEDNPLPRGPRKLTVEEERWIIAAAVIRHDVTPLEMRSAFGLRVCLNSIRKIPRTTSLQNRVACQRRFLIERQEQERLAFAWQHLSWTVQDWKTVVSGDEASFCTKWDQQRRVWRPRGLR